MRNRTLMILSLVLLFIFLVGTANVAANRVAVIGFESADSAWIDDSDIEEELLEEIAWLLNNELKEVDGYTVLDRDRILRILDQTRYSRGSRPSDSIINQLRNEINADYFIYGMLEKVDVRKVDEFKFGPIEYTEIEVTLDLSIDMINARTARTSESFSGRGIAKDTGINLVDSRGDRIRLNLSADDTALNTAIERAVSSLIASITGEEDPQPETRTVEAEIVSIVRNKLVINKGERDGLEVGQTGEIVRPGEADTRRDEPTVIGAAEITEIDINSAILETIRLTQDPEAGDIFNVTVEIIDNGSRRSAREPIEVLETRDFVIEIIEAFKANDRVTILGMAYAKTDGSELEIILGNRSFYDHVNRQRSMSGRRVSIGPRTNSSRAEASLQETIYKDEPVEISWSFTGVPEEADKLSRIELWLSTSREGRISIDIRDLNLSQ